MEYRTIITNFSGHSVTITVNRLLQRNSINQNLLIELNDVLDRVESDPACRVVILEGQNGVFCTGMDFGEFAAPETSGNAKNSREFSDLFMHTLKRFTLLPKIIIAKVDGQAMAGGIGLVAASDLAVATPRSEFSLSEALWGLLPAIVTPYLIRRVGFQTAYRMTLTTLPVQAGEALNCRLVDWVSETPDQIIQPVIQRLRRLEPSTIQNLKQYFRKMWLITEAMEETAVAEITRLMADPLVVRNIENFVKYRKFPWE